MTLIERVKELDRLYLASDAATRAADDATDPAIRRRLRRKAHRLYRAYAALRDSRRGRPAAARAAGVGEGETK